MSGHVLLEFFDDPPCRPHLQRHEEHRGSHDVEPLDPGPNSLFPRRISQDEYLCSKLLRFASKYLSQIDSAPLHSLMGNISVATKRALTAMPPGDEVRNIDIFTHIFNYVREFVTAANEWDIGSIQVVPQANHGEVSWALKRVIQHQGINRILIESISLAAFEWHKGDIWELAGNENGSVELSFEAPGEGVHAIVFRLGTQMISEGVSWALLFGGESYMVFFLQETTHEKENQYHLIISRAYNTFVVPPSPPLSSALIALLLSDKEFVPYNLSRAFGANEEPLGPVLSASPGRGQSRTVEPSHASKTDAETTAVEPCSSRAGERATNLLEILNQSDYWIMSTPSPSTGYNKDPIAKVTSENAWRTVVNIPSIEYFEKDENPPYLFSFLGPNDLATLDCSLIHEFVLKVDGYEEQPCAVKIFKEGFFNDFRREIDAYQALAGEPFALQFYGGFARFRFDQPCGVIFTELFDKLFESTDEMDLGQKRDALECAKQMHRAGYLPHDDTFPWYSFGLRSNGKVVVVDLAHYEKRSCQSCESGDHCREFALNALRKQLSEGVFHVKAWEEDRSLDKKEQAELREGRSSKEEGGAHQNKRRKLAVSKSPRDIGRPAIFYQNCTFCIPDCRPPLPGDVLWKVTSETAVQEALNAKPTYKQTRCRVFPQGEVDGEDDSLRITSMLRLYSECSVFSAAFEHGYSAPISYGAVKVFEPEGGRSYDKLICFQNELRIYEKLQGPLSIPELYAAFAGMLDTGPMGVIVMEAMDNDFWDSYYDMDIDQKAAALECIKELHRAGYHLTNTTPRTFGMRRNREMVIMDLASAEPLDADGICQPEATAACCRIMSLKQEFFGKEFKETFDRLEKLKRQMKA